MGGIQVRQVEHGSPEYFESVDLRREVLRIPLGFDFTERELAAETDELIFCAFESSSELVVGTLNFVNVSDQAVKTLKMRQVAVSATMQGRGVGRRLVEFAEGEAQTLGVETIVLNARVSAVPFYLSLGYKVVGDPFEEVGLPHRAMFKVLSPFLGLGFSS